MHSTFISVERGSTATKKVEETKVDGVIIAGNEKESVPAVRKKMQKLKARKVDLPKLVMPIKDDTPEKQPPMQPLLSPNDSIFNSSFER